MRILALETSGLAGEVALLQDARLVSELPLPSDQRTARSLLPAIRQLLANAGWQPQHIELIAVTIGPGSFTGLRVGVTAAKTLAYALGAQTIGVDTLEVAASQVPLGAPQARLWSVLDAQRAQLFALALRCDGASWRPLAPVAILDNDAFLAQLAAGDSVTGSGLKKLVPQIPSSVAVIQESLWRPQAAAVGRLAWRDYQQGRRDDFWRLAPHYLRPSAAEEKAAGASAP